jgi:VCBS repeat-containing protein
MKRKTLTACALAVLASSLVTGTSVGTSSAASSDLLISELRLDGPNGPNDEFIEIYNPSASTVTVAVDDGSSGWAVVASDGVARFVIPNGTMIPARGHYLGVNSVGYSLATYPAGEGTTATGDATYATGIPNNAGVAIFRTSTPANFTLANRSDAVGSASEANALYKEGTGYGDLAVFGINDSFARDEISGVPADTGNNATDFLFYDTNGTSAGAGQRLGAPGPQNLSSPVQMNGTLPMTPLDPGSGPYVGANMVRDFTSVPAQNSTFGTVLLRRTITNNTGANVTRLRINTAFVNTFPSALADADLRGRTSLAEVVALSGGGSANVFGTTLEQPPSQPNGSGFNGTFSATNVTVGTPLSPGASINLDLYFGIQQTGSFDVNFNVEAFGAGTATSGPSNALTCNTEGCVANTAPVAVDDAANVAEDGTLNVAAPGVLGNDTDVDADGLTAVLDTNVSNGVLNLFPDGHYDYSPNLNFHGVDSFTYHANDGTADGNIATVTITVDPANDPPVAPDDAYNVNEDTLLDVNAATGVLANDTDIDPNPLTAVLDTDVANGTLVLNADGSFTYTPDADFTGVDTFTYHANDGSADSPIATVTITVDPVNDAPVADTDAYVVSEDNVLTVNATLGVQNGDVDVDLDTLSAVIDTTVAHGTLVLNADGSFTYTPDANFNGTDSFTYHDNDGTVPGNVVTVTITVDPVNDLPVAVDDGVSVSVLGGVATVSVLADDTDVDGDALSVVSWTNGAQGAVTCTSTQCMYEPNPDSSGSDSFTYTLSDGHGGSAVGTVQVTLVSGFRAVTFDNTNTTTLPLTGSDPFGLLVLGGGLVALGFVLLQTRRFARR